MRSCWQYREEDRPTFKLLAQELADALIDLKEEEEFKVQQYLL